MGLVRPDLGLLFWMLLSFGTVLFLLGKFAWKPIMDSLKEREDSIENALKAADRVKDEMASLQSKNEELLKKARDERDQMLKDAKAIKDKMISEARDKATEEANKIFSSARENIENEKMAAITELKNEIASLSIEIAEKVLTQELSDPTKQKRYIETLLKDIKLN